ncbi:MAG: UDP-3-O-(3-hydroxymyristoyl)glucosamine N-acyltransferase [Proteobacteria bacterium]|nr:UDP-3-O-(3-hydroxymyristoyl)glucosamine N-acyltransferase [Pseudomonadota bacterium]
MADPRFFARHGPFTLAKLAEVSRAALGPGADGNRSIIDLAPLDRARESDIAFLDNRKYIGALERSSAGACVLDPKYTDRAPSGVALLLSNQPYLAFARIARAFYPQTKLEPCLSDAAHIHDQAQIAPRCRVDPGASIASGCKIGEGCHIAANAVLERGVVLGEDCRIGAGATLSHCLVGDRVVVYPGVRIGQDGFGFASGPDGHLSIPQVGRVLIGDDVEIGANTTIDRGSGNDTVIGDGCRIDNLVQIAHNVQLGKGCVIVSLVGISGSTKLGDYVVVGGQSGFAGHLNIGDGAKFAARSGVIHDLAAGQEYGGAPAIAARQWKRQMIALARLAQRKDET